MGHLFGRPRETEGDSTYERRALKALRMQSGPDKKLFQHQKRLKIPPKKLRMAFLCSQDAMACNLKTFCTDGRAHIWYNIVFVQW